MTSTEAGTRRADALAAGERFASLESSTDHLELHTDLEGYYAAKASL